MVSDMSKHELQGSWYTTNELSEMSGIPAHTIRDRLRRGYSVEESIKDIPIHDSIKEFCNASYYLDWVGMSIDELHTIYWKWCINNHFTALEKRGFSRQINSIYPMLYTVPTTNKDKCSRVIRLRKEY